MCVWLVALLLSLAMMGCSAAPALAGTGAGYGYGYAGTPINSGVAFGAGTPQLLINQGRTYPLNANGLLMIPQYGYGGYGSPYNGGLGIGAGVGMPAYYRGYGYGPSAYAQQAQVQLQLQLQLQQLERLQQQQINIPAKQHLPAQILDYGTEREPTVEILESANPVTSIPTTTLPTTTLPMSLGPTLAPATLPTTITTTQTMLPERVETPLKAQVLPTQYREQVIEQRIIEPVLKTRPLLQQHIIDEQLIQPIKQHTTQIQPVITTPVLRQVVTKQPLQQDQIQTQTIVRRHVVEQPHVVHHTVNQYQTGAQQMEQVEGDALPTLTRGDDAITAILQQDADTPTNK